jgi:hypothetical protein
LDVLFVLMLYVFFQGLRAYIYSDLIFSFRASRFFCSAALMVRLIK